MTRHLIGCALLLLTASAEAQTTRTSQEGMRCAAAALALHDIATAEGEKAHYSAQAEAFIKTFADAVENDPAAEKRLSAEFTDVLVQYRARRQALGPGNYIVAADKDYRACGGKHLAQ